MSEFGDRVGDFVISALPWVVGGIAAIVALVAVVSLVAWMIGLGGDTYTDRAGTIVARAYTPDTQQTSTVPTVTSSGRIGVGVGIVTTGNPEDFFVLVKVDGKVHKFSDMGVWAECVVGQSVKCRMKSNRVWGDMGISVLEYVK